MAIAIATTLQVPAQESKTKLTAQQRTEQRIKEMDEKLTLSDEQKALFTRCAESRRELQSITERLLFKNSFRLGARLTLEVMEG